MTAPRTATLLALALVACGGTRATETIPSLPGDGNRNTARPVAHRDAKGDGPWADESKLIKVPDTGPAQPLELPESERLQLKNGLVVILVPSKAAPAVSFQLAVRAGREHVSRDKVGVARLAALALAHGTRSRSAKAIQKTLETAGANLDASASYEAALLSCDTGTDSASTCLDLLADITINPTFPAAEVAALEKDVKESVRRRIRDGAKLADAHLQNLLWGAGHPRGWPASERTIGAISRADLVAWHRRWYHPNNAVLAVAGDFDAAALKKRIERSFGRWARARLPETKVPAAPDLSGISIRLIDKPDQEGADIRVGRFGVGHRDPAFFAATLVNQVLGGGPGSRLARAADGAAVRSQLDRNLHPGALVVSAAAKTDDAVATIRSIRDAMSELASSGPSAAEVAAAGIEVAGEYATHLRSSADVAGALLAAELHGLPAQYVERYPVKARGVSVAQATAAAKSLLRPDRLAVVVVGPARRIAKQLDAAGWKYEVLGFVDPVGSWERDAAKTEARKILDDALAAKGGAKLLSKLRTFHWKGKATLAQRNGGSTTAAVEKRYKAPGRLRLDMDLKDAGGNQVKLVTVMTGNAGWAQRVMGGKSQSVEFPQAEVQAGKSQIWRDQDLVLLRHRDKGTKVVLVDELEVSGAPSYAVRITSADNKNTVVLYIDKKTKLLRGMTYQERTPQGRPLVTEERYSDYRSVSGLKMAHRRTTKSAQLDLTTKLDWVKINVPIDDGLFVKPKS